VITPIEQSERAPLFAAGARSWTHAERTACGTRLPACMPNTSGDTWRRSDVHRCHLLTGESAIDT
jgi:hypothetical protein